MSDRKFTRRDFIGRSTFAAATMVSLAYPQPEQTGSGLIAENHVRCYQDDEFIKEIEKLPVEEPYAYHKYLITAPAHILRRDPGARRGKNKMSVPEKGWSIVCDPESTEVMKLAVLDFQDYMVTSQNVKVSVREITSFFGNDMVSANISIDDLKASL